MRRKDSGAVRITSATRSHSDDIASRQRRYVVSMTIRTICFILAVVFAGTFLMWIFIIASFILPYIAVVMANAGGSTDPGGPDPFDPGPQHKEIEPPH
ncbi:MAG TPA: DUF3099 domain-containing protein [Nocardioidaceae bacterium]|jgi:hypothetical protein|nr:DUF3099 domain-containing protein [Nocardioidaceae bacterium]